MKYESFIKLRRSIILEYIQDVGPSRLDSNLIYQRAPGIGEWDRIQDVLLHIGISQGIEVNIYKKDTKISGIHITLTLYE